MRNVKTVNFYRKRLPHWEVEQGCYFVTLREYGSLPKDKELAIWSMSQELKRSPDDAKRRLERRLFASLEKWLHELPGNAQLAEPAVARMIMSAIRHMADQGFWSVFEYVVMPNHLHLMIEIKRDSLWDNMVRFKRWTGRQGTGLVNHGGKPFWQREWFDHWPRSEAEFEGTVDYIRRNPVKAGLVNGFGEWPFAAGHEQSVSSH